MLVIQRRINADLSFFGKKNQLKRIGEHRVQVGVTDREVARIRKAGESIQLPELRPVDTPAIAQLKIGLLPGPVTKVYSGKEIDIVFIVFKNTCPVGYPDIR